MWDDLTIGYLAALIDGEGYIKLAKLGVSVSVASTDYDIVERAHQMSGIGTIQGPYLNKHRVKPNWRWNVSKKADVARLLCAITPLMSERKRATQILPVAEYLAKRLEHKTCCLCGCSYLPTDGSYMNSKYCTRTCRYGNQLQQGKNAAVEDLGSLGSETRACCSCGASYLPRKRCLASRYCSRACYYQRGSSP